VFFFDEKKTGTLSSSFVNSHVLVDFSTATKLRNSGIFVVPAAAAAVFTIPRACLSVSK
jgi:hypothetical protein